MELNFDNYPGIQPKITPVQRYATQFSLSLNLDFALARVTTSYEGVGGGGVDGAPGPQPPAPRSLWVEKREQKHSIYYHPPFLLPTVAKGFPCSSSYFQYIIPTV